MGFFFMASVGHVTRRSRKKTPVAVIVAHLML